MKLISESKRNNKSVWENINKIIKKEGKSIQNLAIKENSKVIEDKEKVATIFNSFFVDSVQCLAKKFGERPRILEATNNEFPVFNIERVSDSIVMRALDCIKGSKSKDLFDIDAHFLKNYESILCKPIN